MNRIFKIGQNVTFYIAFLATFSLFLLLVAGKPTMALEDKGYNNNLQIINGSDKKITTTFKVKIARDKATQEKGLMFVKNLPEDYGLLFDFNQDGVSNIWMKNTFISLDILFINKDDEIVKIFNSASPLSETVISSKIPVRKVLEINSGLVKKLNIQLGDKVKLVP